MTAPDAFPNVKEASHRVDWQRCFSVAQELRPHLELEAFLQQVARQQQQGYRLIYLAREQEVVSILGYRIQEYLAWGKILYIDDLATLSHRRGQGYGALLLNWAIVKARAEQCDQVHLDSGYSRHEAHRLYLNQGFQLKSHHFALTL